MRIRESTYEAYPVSAYPIISLCPLGPVLWWVAEGGPFSTVLSLPIFKAFTLGEHHSDIYRDMATEIQTREMIL